jgi:hypothetical protein
MAFAESRSLIGNHAVLKAIETGSDPRNEVEEMRDSLDRFVERRENYLLYR